MESWPDVYPARQNINRCTFAATPKCRRPRRGHSNVLASVLGEHTRNHLLVGFEINQESFARPLVVVMVSLIGTILYAQQFSYPFP